MMPLMFSFRNNMLVCIYGEFWSDIQTLENETREREKNVDSVLFYSESLLIFDSQCKQKLMA